MNEEKYYVLKYKAQKFLVECGKLTIIERRQQGETDPQLSADELLGMATRIMAEVAKEVQDRADEEEQN